MGSGSGEGTEPRPEIPPSHPENPEDSSSFAPLVLNLSLGGFWSYVAGTAYQVALTHRVGGLRIDNYKTTLPLKKGLSSSAAVCVLVARAFSEVYHLSLTTRGEMEYAFLGETTGPSRQGSFEHSTPFVRRIASTILPVRQTRSCELHSTDP